MNRLTVKQASHCFAASVYLRKYIFISVSWSLLVGASLSWNVHQVHENTLLTAAAAARASINKDIIFRAWATSHGGVYVPPTKLTPPNPYLKVPDRDVVTTTGKALTLINPAYMLRDLQTHFGKQYGNLSHLSSLNPINPNNFADSWERKALKSFEQGRKELMEVQEIKRQPYLRLMQPFVVEKGCLKCHAVQGYRLGDVRGGLGISVPLIPYLAQERKQNANLALSHGVIWLMGFLAQGFSSRRENRLNYKRRQAERKLKQYHNHLEELVKERTAQLTKAKDDAETANIAKSTFIATMSHELRTPLNAIMGFSELMSRDETATVAQKETLGIINRSGSHLLRMINDVLDISKIEAGRQELNIQAFDLLEFLHDIGEMISVKALDNRLGFHLEIGSGIPQHIKSDSGKLRQVLINLLGNAIKFTPHGGMILRVSKLPAPAATNLLPLSFEVVDSGIGIPQDKLGDLFKPFSQVGEANANQQGTGLGLAISKSLITLMGGSISVASTLGVGSTFKIGLAVPVANAGEINVAEEWRPVKSLAPNQAQWRLLVVDDNADNRLLLVTLLANMGFQVREAENGLEAVHLFAEWHPELIWMDMRMPVMDGYEATQKIRHRAGGDAVKIIALTASVFKEQHQSIINAGCDAVLHKPFHAPEIFAALAKHLGVEFIYQDTKASAPLPPVDITAEMLSQLPLELRRQLHQAAVNLDMEETAAAILRIRSLAPDVADGLQELAEHYQFEPIIHLTQP